MARIRCSDPNCDRKFHLSQKNMQEYHRTHGVNSEEKRNGVSQSSAMNDFSSSALLTEEEQELFEDIKDAFQTHRRLWVEKNDRFTKLQYKKQDLANYIQKHERNVEWQRKNQDVVFAMFENSTDPTPEEALQKLRKKWQEFDNKVKELKNTNAEREQLEKDINDLKETIIPGISIVDATDEEKDIIRKSLSQCYLEEIHKPRPYEDPYPGSHDDKAVQEECGRCGGSGIYAGYGVCYSCDGTGKYNTTVGRVRYREKKIYQDEMRSYNNQLRKIPQRVQRSIDMQEKHERKIRGIDPEHNEKIAKEQKNQQDIERLTQQYPEKSRLESHSVKVTSSRSFMGRSYMGGEEWKQVINFEDENGDNFVWFTTSDIELSQGDTCNIKGSIKRVSMNKYTNSPQVELSRVRASDIVSQ